LKEEIIPKKLVAPNVNQCYLTYSATHATELRSEKIKALASRHIHKGEALSQATHFLACTF